MTRDNTIALLAYLTRLNPAMRIVEGMVDAWHDQLADYDQAEVEAAARKVGGEQTWVGVADIRNACRSARATRLSQAGNLAHLVTTDPGDAKAWVAELARVTDAVKRGRSLPQLEAGGPR